MVTVNTVVVIPPQFHFTQIIQLFCCVNFHSHFTVTVRFFYHEGWIADGFSLNCLYFKHGYLVFTFHGFLVCCLLFCAQLFSFTLANVPWSKYYFDSFPLIPTLDIVLNIWRSCKASNPSFKFLLCWQVPDVEYHSEVIWGDAIGIWFWVIVTSGIREELSGSQCIPCASSSVCWSLWMVMPNMNICFLLYPRLKSNGNNLCCLVQGQLLVLQIYAAPILQQMHHSLLNYIAVVYQTLVWHRIATPPCYMLFLEV